MSVAVEKQRDFIRSTKIINTFQIEFIRIWVRALV
jgi:hypothetical protein